MGFIGNCTYSATTSFDYFTGDAWGLRDRVSIKYRDVQLKPPSEDDFRGRAHLAWNKFVETADYYISVHLFSRVFEAFSEKQYLLPFALEVKLLCVGLFVSNYWNQFRSIESLTIASWLLSSILIDPLEYIQDIDFCYKIMAQIVACHLVYKLAMGKMVTPRDLDNGLYYGIAGPWARHMFGAYIFPENLSFFAQEMLMYTIRKPLTNIYGGFWSALVNPEERVPLYKSVLIEPFTIGIPNGFLTWWVKSSMKELAQAHWYQESPFHSSLPLDSLDLFTAGAITREFYNEVLYHYLSRVLKHTLATK